MRERILRETDLGRVQDTRAQPRPQNELNSRPKRLAAKRKIDLRTSSPSTLMAPNDSNTIAQNSYSESMNPSSYFRCF